MWQVCLARANLFIFINKFSLDGWNPFSSNGVGSLGGNLLVAQARVLALVESLHYPEGFASQHPEAGFSPTTFTWNGWNTAQSRQLRAKPFEKGILTHIK